MSVSEETRKMYKDHKFKIVNGFLYENKHCNRIRSCVPNFVQTNTASGPQYTNSFDIIMHLLSLRRRYSAQSATMEMRRRQKFNGVSSKELSVSESITEPMQSPRKSAPPISESKAEPTQSPRKSATKLSETTTERMQSLRRSSPSKSESTTERVQSPRRSVTKLTESTTERMQSPKRSVTKMQESTTERMQSPNISAPSLESRAEGMQSPRRSATPNSGFTTERKRSLRRSEAPISESKT